MHRQDMVKFIHLSRKAREILQYVQVYHGEKKIKISANYMVSTPFSEIENEYTAHGKGRYFCQK